MKANYFNQRSTVVISTRILLAPRVETAIVESTIADILGLAVSTRDQLEMKANCFIQESTVVDSTIFLVETN
jgi:hypothetical protein